MRAYIYLIGDTFVFYRCVCNLSHGALGKSISPCLLPIRLEKDSTVFFDLQHVVRLVMKDQWEEAARYVSAFVPFQNASKEVSHLRRYMFMNFVVQNIAFGGEQGDRFASMYAPDPSDAFKFAQQQRDRSSEWEQMRHKTVAMLKSLVPRTTELKDKLQFSFRMTMLPGLVPVGLPEFRRRRRFKEGRVSKLNAALLRKRLHSIQERNQSGLPSNTSSVCTTLDTEMEQTFSLSSFCSGGTMQQAETAVSTQENQVVQTCNTELLFTHASALHQSEELSAAIQRHRAHTPMLKNIGHHASVTRICLTRLLCYLRQYGFYDTAHALEGDAGLFYSKWYMEEMVAKFQWNEAAKYMSAFVPDCDCSKEASNLLRVMHRLKRNLKASKVTEKISFSCLNASPLQISFVQPDTCWSSCWKELRHTAIAALNDLVPRTPELKDKLQLPYYKTKLSDTIPIGLQAYQRHCWRRVNNMPAHCHARFILQNRVYQKCSFTDRGFTQVRLSGLSISKLPGSKKVMEFVGVPRIPISHRVLPTLPTAESSEISTSASNAERNSVPFVKG
ncbi:hypothetical protein PR202_gb01535 [Eleusine coracana subsp. coracana]|uniref:Uncharacterized protein n=1 Tax=Eleusine coracana subsp. coracana TaxID=191504 RepID=A0AAV5DXP3_ELECO|nr:hypothetical protein PR202_gb01535 [Eleusine coracana subsp. coracana]